ncbi:MAG: ABC transporter permease [Phycisphaerales bacterium]|nr:ABC transporter permease [Phycisphaerales bacterium]
MTRIPSTNPMARLGRRLSARVIAAGEFTRFVFSSVGALGAVRSWSRRDRLGAQLYFVGTTSLPVLALTGAFIGMILAIEGYLQFASIGQESRLGGVINISLAKQIGPVLAAVVLAGRVGCALTAELGSMRVTEQLDAMRAMAADPIRVLVVPRVMACVLMIPVLTIVSNLCGIVGAWLIATQLYDADQTLYWRFTRAFVSWFDVVNGLSKSVVFGAAIGLIACYKGFTCRPGAEGVGRATTQSFVTSFLAIIVINLSMAKLLNEIDLWRSGGTLDSMFG